MIAPAHHERSYESEAGHLMAVAQLVQGVDLKLLIETSSTTDSIGPFLDPTAWHRSKHDHRKVAELAALLQPFQRRAQEIIEEAKVQQLAREGA